MKGVSFILAAVFALASPALASGEPPIVTFDPALAALVDCAEAKAAVQELSERSALAPPEAHRLAAVFVSCEHKARRDVETTNLLRVLAASSFLIAAWGEEPLLADLDERDAGRALDRIEQISQTSSAGASSSFSGFGNRSQYVGGYVTDTGISPQYRTSDGGSGGGTTSTRTFNSRWIPAANVLRARIDALKAKESDCADAAEG